MIGKLFDLLGIYITALVLILLGMLISDEFLTAQNQLSILNAIALLGMTSVGMTFITYSGNMADLSIPSIMAFSGIMAVAFLSLGLIPALLIGLISGMAIGAMNGWVVGRFNANPILWTLAVSFFMEGFMRFTWSNNQVYPDVPGTAGDSFVGLFRLKVGPVPLIVIVMFLLFCAGHVVLTWTRFGAMTRLVGSSRQASWVSGVRVRRIILLNFLLASFCASVAGMFITSMNKLGVFYLGKGYDFKSVTAVVLGGVMLSGGKGNMLGVLGGVLVMGLLSNILTFMGVNTFQQDIVTGSIFITVVGLHQLRLRSQGRDHA